MNKGLVAIVLVALAGATVGVIAMKQGGAASAVDSGSLAQKAARSTPAAAAALTGPPAGATILPVEVNRELMLGEYLAARKEDEKAAVLATYKGSWAPTSGWQGTVEDVTKEKDGIALRIWTPVSTMATTGYWTIVVLEGKTSTTQSPVQKGGFVVFGGQISDIQVIEGGPIPTARIIVRPAYIIGT